MRVVLVEFPPSGGLFQFAFQLGSGLARLGHQVVLVTGPDPELSSTQPGFRVAPVLPTWHPGATRVEHPLLRKARRALRGAQLTLAWVRLLVVLRRLRPDAVLWSEWRFPLDGWFVGLTARLLGGAGRGTGRGAGPATGPDTGTVLAKVAHEPRPLVEQSTSSGALYKADSLLRSALARAYRHMQVVFVLGEEARSVVEEAWRPAGPVVVIPHGDESVFAEALVKDDLTAVQDTGPEVLFFGTWTRYKGLLVLLDAFARVRGRRPDARLVVAGAVGADMDFGEIHRTAEQIGGVLLRPGYVPMAEVPVLLGAARVVALPYLRASQSGVAHLAQTFGRPVVASRVGDIPAAVPDGECGLLVPPGDVGALADALLRLLDDPEAAERLGRAGAERLASEGSWDDIATRVADALTKAARGA